MTRAGHAALAAVASATVLAFATSADAHTLTIERAHSASLRGAERHCDRDQYCDTVSATSCRRAGATGHRRRHRARCDILLGGTDLTSDWQCTWVDQWSIRSGSNKLRWSQAVYDATWDCHYLAPA
jgi:hypothetical protein